jgi:hypothetical protein
VGPATGDWWDLQKWVLLSTGLSFSRSLSIVHDNFPIVERPGSESDVHCLFNRVLDSLSILLNLPLCHERMLELSQAVTRLNASASCEGHMLPSRILYTSAYILVPTSYACPHL